ncbi:hypothetical protein VCR5J5_180016 [Vibrio crassostreae]|uniref:Uncharacterized protein n=1 Tax=Vibrio crassostreae TaxID=246167 RepID=A0A822MXS5_9VIBR|nr:hypothetical protein VCR9J2_1570016 [Vibrio crassostreae]CDT21059.1 hypothetical protein VCR5J5_180016 [Vibrio crassostreae]
MSSQHHRKAELHFQGRNEIQRSKRERENTDLERAVISLWIC